MNVTFAHAVLHLGQFRKGDIYSAYKCLNRLSKPKPKAITALWQQDCYNQLRGAMLSGPVIAQVNSRQKPHLPLSPSTASQPNPNTPTIPPCPEPSLEKVVKAIKHLKNNKSPGICSILLEMLKYGSNEVHLAMHRLTGFVTFHQAAAFSVYCHFSSVGAETWTLLNKHCSALGVFLMSCLRHICGTSLKDHISNAAILSMC